MPDGVISELFQAALGFASIFLIFYSLRRRVIGREGIVIERSNPYATIRIDGQKWRAVAEDGSSLSEGDLVVVSGVKGLQLAVVSRLSK
jgi:membrane protein implicated in regulation of membrane protease activity